MARIIGIQFEKNGKMYYFDPEDLEPALGTYVIVDTVRGADLAEVIMEAREIEDTGLSQIRKVIRIATEQDIQRASENRVKEREAYQICQKKIEEHKLEMKLVSVEYAFDSSKVLFYFTANGRVDFRSLVKDLASVFKTRIELRQIGVRDEAKMLGGLGPCGRPICCGAFLNDFQPVSIRMAKEQNLSLNPTKISGVCGRLMCCLKYEQEQYEQVRKRMPKVGKQVETPDGSGIVTALNIVKETISVRISSGDSSEIREYPMDQISRTNGKPDTNTAAISPQDMTEEQEDSNNDIQESADLQDISDPDLEQLLGEDNGAEDAIPASETAVRSRTVSRNRNQERQERREPKKRRNTEKERTTPRERPAAGEKTVPDKNSDHKLGQPVRRENTRKVKASEAPAEKLSSPRPSASLWAEQLKKAMKSIEHD